MNSVKTLVYMGALFVQLGAMIWHGSILLIVYILVFIFAFYMLIVFFEEPVLRKTFGTAYEEYCRNVPRWIPKLK